MVTGKGSWLKVETFVFEGCCWGLCVRETGLTDGVSLDSGGVRDLNGDCSSLYSSLIRSSDRETMREGQDLWASKLISWNISFTASGWLMF